MARSLRVTVWNENLHEQNQESVKKIYPKGMHAPIAEGIERELSDAEVRIATLEQPEHGLTEKVLAETDVLTWWGHAAHERVEDTIVDRVHERVLDGMGLVVLHSAHKSKIFVRLMGTSCRLRWREMGERELVWTVSPSHPIASRVPQPIVIPHQEMYGEFFDIPPPDELVFISSFEGGEVFRGGCCFHRGAGRIFYFSPGHEEYPVYFQPEIQRVIANAVAWCGGRSTANDLPSTRTDNAPHLWFLNPD